MCEAIGDNDRAAQVHVPGTLCTLLKSLITPSMLSIS